VCGIFGIWHTDGTPVDLSAVCQATTQLRHRGPDDEGYLLIDARSGHVVPCGGDDTDARLALPHVAASNDHAAFDAAFGFRRLAILDVSPAGHQPMTSADRRYWIIFNGEIYNYLELRSELAGFGFSFQTGTDTEVILAAYQRWGTDCLSHFNGMWALAIWDSQARELFIARDRFGVKPLYYVWDGVRFAFASEIKALVGRHGIPFKPDDYAIFRYLVGGLLPSPQQGRTFFEGVQSLPPGYWLRVNAKGVIRQRYWTLATASDSSPHVDSANAVEQYRALFTDSIRLRLRADVPIGTCLSGGVDSSSIVCVVNRLIMEGGVPSEQIGRQQKTFSAVYEAAGRFNERHHVEKVLAATGAERNLVFPTQQKLREDIERLVWHQDEPFGSTSIFAQWCVMRRVRERGVTVLLDGQGADEALAGYRPFAFLVSELIRRGQFLRALTEARQAQAVTDISALRLLGRATLWQLPQPWIDVFRSRRLMRDASEAGLNPEFAAPIAGNVLAGMIAETDHLSLKNHLLDQVCESSLPHLLRYEDRNSMAFSVEARVPFLDYRLVELSFNEAADWRIHQGWTKWVLRQAMSGIVPDEIIWRRDKVGFETPERDWLRDEPDLLGENAACRDYLDIGLIRAKLARGVEPGEFLAWRWINFELWLRAWRSQQ
jgi:asparagine synthase (glutamine-hydrolysing)